MCARVTKSTLEKIVTILCADSSLLTKMDKLLWRLGILPVVLVQNNWSLGFKSNQPNDYLSTCLAHWISIKGEQATFENLTRALRKSYLIWVADTVEKTFNLTTIAAPTKNPMLDPIHSVITWSGTVTSARRESLTLVGGKVHLDKLQLILLAKGLLTEKELQVMESKPVNISKLTYLYIHSDLTKKPSFFQHLKEAFEETCNIIPLQILQMFNSEGI